MSTDIGESDVDEEAWCCEMSSVDVRDRSSDFVLLLDSKGRAMLNLVQRHLYRCWRTANSLRTACERKDGFEELEMTSQGWTGMIRLVRTNVSDFLRRGLLKFSLGYAITNTVFRTSNHWDGDSE